MMNAENLTAYAKVQAARASQRPMGGFYIERMIDNFIELHGDRRFGDDSAIIGGIGYLNERPVTVIAMERGKTVEERMKRKQTPRVSVFASGERSCARRSHNPKRIIA